MGSIKTFTNTKLEKLANLIDSIHEKNSRGYYYAARNINGGKLFMHRAIIKPTKDVKYLK